MNFLKIRLHFLLSVILTQIMSDFLKFVILFLAIPVGLVISVEGRAQEIDTVLTKFESGKVVVNYTFAKGTPDENYELYLYGSHDNFTRPMQQTIGDIGKNIRPGGQKIIYWDANRELGNFKGDLILKVQGGKYTPFVSYENTPPDLKIKRGSYYTFEWKHDKTPEKILLNILRNNVPVQESVLMDNTGKFMWSVPTNQKAGGGYQVEIIDTNNHLRRETSENFVVRRKIPLGLKLLPLVIVGGTALVLTSDTDAGGIPDPPPPPR